MQHSQNQQQNQSQRQQSEHLSSSNSTQYFVINCILDYSLDDNDEDVFLVKWAGYSSIHDSWEPLSSFLDVNILAEYLINKNTTLSDARERVRKWKGIFTSYEQILHYIGDDDNNLTADMIIHSLATLEDDLQGGNNDDDNNKDEEYEES